ncbi:SIR2 family protein [Candidatus Sulfidibacterium hydrothermale]|uniref:SIR2 family protein n=1 Tax=Candidatus Sulfidibacterium hydrothermale TaxID=2875962 RepID=UPI001F0A9433|nr:SIR2 family protein [Candidatus Sulfidibacterium hydrothermale]UBM61374.1 SIR2 family protein [Candidatus Sulfidibacterium hydrothermale]
MENTIFFGNGINRLSASNISWDDILKKIKGLRMFDDDTLPNTMTYERIILEKPSIHKDILYDEFEVKKNIADLMKSIGTHRFYNEMYDLDVQHYLTTNYDYAFINTILERNDINTPIFEYSSEDVYSVRRLKRISNKKQHKKHFWQIHGEIRKPATIMLGLDHYCGSIGKIDSYIKGGYSYTVDKKQIS